MFWSWMAFAVGYIAGALSLFFLLGVMHLGARNDEIKPSVPEQSREKQKNGLH